MASVAQAGMARPGRSGLPEITPVPWSRARFSFPYRPVACPPGGGAALSFTAALDLAAGASEAVRGSAAFLADTVYGTVPLETLAAVIGRFALATGAAPDGTSITLAADREQSTQPVKERDLAVEDTGFGAAHVLYEDARIGCYILEIAPGHSIPAHCHRVMREWELILDDGLLQQGSPVARGTAYDWPLGHVHAYRNPTARPLRILCIDSPRFDPADEQPLIPAPPLVPLAPFAEYPV
jgi:mannose-6-phosphate isomerase-like protein (cupin superfamily)